MLFDVLNHFESGIEFGLHLLQTNVWKVGYGMNST